LYLALEANVGYNVLLPTFRCTLRNFNIRCMKDTGAQPNFIKLSLAKKLNLPIVNANFPMTVSGWNTSHDYVTKIVKVELCIGDSII